MRDFALNTAGTDLAFDGYEFSFVDGSARVAQNLAMRLRTFKGEWFLDTSVGVPWLGRILVKGPSGGLVRSILKDVILKTEDVTELTSFSMELDNATRELTVSFSVETTFGTISGEV